MARNKHNVRLLLVAHKNVSSHKQVTTEGVAEQAWCGFEAHLSQNMVVSLYKWGRLFSFSLGWEESSYKYHEAHSYISCIHEGNSCKEVRMGRRV